MRKQELITNASIYFKYTLILNFIQITVGSVLVLYAYCTHTASVPPRFTRRSNICLALLNRWSNTIIFYETRTEQKHLFHIDAVGAGCKYLLVIKLKMYFLIYVEDTGHFTGLFFSVRLSIYVYFVSFNNFLMLTEQY